MNKRQLMYMAVILGIALGVLAARFLFVGSWYSVIIWGIAGILIGYRALDRKTARLAGSLYGFVLVAMFIFSDYGGAMTVRGLAGVGVLALVFGTLGALGGLLAAFVGNMLKRKGRQMRA